MILCCCSGIMYSPYTLQLHTFQTCWHVGISQGSRLTFLGHPRSRCRHIPLISALTPAPTDLALIQHLQDELSKERQKRDEIKAQLEKVKVERDALAAQLDAIKGKVGSSVLLVSFVLWHITCQPDVCTLKIYVLHTSAPLIRFYHHDHHCRSPA